MASSPQEPAAAGDHCRHWGSGMDATGGISRPPAASGKNPRSHQLAGGAILVRNALRAFSKRNTYATDGRLRSVQYCTPSKKYMKHGLLPNMYKTGQICAAALSILQRGELRRRMTLPRSKSMKGIVPALAILALVGTNAYANTQRAPQQETAVNLGTANSFGVLAAPASPTSARKQGLHLT